MGGKGWRGPPARLGWEIPLWLLGSYCRSGNWGVPACPCTPSLAQLPGFACLASDFPSLPPVLQLAMTEPPEMPKDLAIPLFRVRKTFFPHGKAVTWMQSGPPNPSTPFPSPAFSLRNQIITLLTSLFPCLPEPNMNPSSNPACKCLKVEQLGSRSCRMRGRVCGVWHRRTPLLAWALRLYGKRQLRGN